MVTGPRPDDDKEREIARSLLPASRSAAHAARRSLRAAHRVARRRDRASLRSGDWSAVATINDRQRRAEVRTTMHVRRLSDNLGAFYRWADAVTRSIDDPIERYFAVERRLGTDTMQARHALDHLAWRRGYERPGEDDWLERWLARRGDEPRSREVRRRQLRRKLHRALTEDLGEFNRLAKELDRGRCRCNLDLVAAGVHDEARLADLLARRPGPCGHWCLASRDLARVLETLYPRNVAA